MKVVIELRKRIVWKTTQKHNRLDASSGDWRSQTDYSVMQIFPRLQALKTIKIFQMFEISNLDSLN